MKNDSSRMGENHKMEAVLTEVSVPDVGLRAFALGDDICEFVSGTLRGLL